MCLVPISARGGWLHHLAPGPAERPLVVCTVYDDVIPLFPGYVGSCEEPPRACARVAHVGTGLGIRGPTGSFLRTPTFGVTMSRTFFVGGNWKMNGSVEQYQSLINNLLNAKLDSSVEVVISPPSLYLLPSQKLLEGKNIALGAQNAYFKPSGAFTGEISVAQLKDAGIPWVILGHSERRSIFGESDELVGQKTTAALESGLSVILCVGESLEQREKNESVNVVIHQLETATKDVKDWGKIVIAYEPVWAIGTGKVASAADAQEVCGAIRKTIAEISDQELADSMRILYGGSVNAGNVAEIVAEEDVDGGLVGGASLKADEFAKLCALAANSAA